MPLSRLPANPRAALAHLRKADPKLAVAIDAVGPFRLPNNPATLDELCRSIIGQQLSVVVAARINERFSALVGGLSTASPSHLLTFSVEQFRSVGLSNAKARTVHALADFWAAKELSPERAAAMADEELIELLTQVKGIGPWTVKMFLIFCLRRPNVLPHEDLGLRAGLKKIHRMKEMPTAREAQQRAARWAPWCTVGTWYAWQYLKVD